MINDTKQKTSQPFLFNRIIKPGVSILCCLLLSQCQEADPDKKSPNFIFILTDDQGWQGTSVQMDTSRVDSRSDYYETPNLERLAREGMRFSNGYSPAPICTPARRSMQFGQTPAQQRGTRFKSEFDAYNGMSIPKMLKSINPRYVSAHLGKWSRDVGASPKEVGYYESDGKTNNRTGGASPGRAKWSKFEAVEDPKLIFSVTDRAIAFMEKHSKARRPFYLQISHYAVHVDVQARQETIDKYQVKATGEIHQIPAFAAMTEDLDTGIGLILDKVKELGISGNTYIFFASDNGAVPWVPPDMKKQFAYPMEVGRPSRNYPLRNGKWSLFEGGLRVPIIVKGPGIKANSICEVPVVAWDFLPTFCDLADSTKRLPENLDGGSMRMLLENAGKGEVKRSYEGLVFHAPFSKPPHSAIRLGDFKLLKFWEEKKLLLFNLKDDIGEKNDLAPSMPEKVKLLNNKLMTYLREVNAEIPESQ